MGKKTVLITGIAGFIGSNLADRLVKEGYAVVGIDNLAYGLREQVPQEATLHVADIRSKDIYPLFSGVDVVVHLAAKNSLPDCQKDPVETMDINVVGTANVFEAARRAGVKKVLYAQSSAVEEGDNRLKGFYAISKMADQWIDEGYKDAFGLTTVGLRYFNVYGPRQNYRRRPAPVVSTFIMKMLTNQPVLLFEDDDKNTRDFIHVDDLNDFHVLAIEDDRTNNKMFRLGSGKSTSVREIYDLIKKILNVTSTPALTPRPDNPDFKPAETLADISDAKALGWSPKVTLEAGLTSMVDYLKSEQKKGNLL